MAYDRKQNKRGYSNETIRGKGNLGADPKLISGKNAEVSAVALRVGSNSMSIDKNGNEIERLVWRDIKLFGRDADAALSTLKKGDRVYYEGSMFPTEYTDRDGNVVETWEIICRDGVSVGMDYSNTGSGEGSSNRSSRRRNDDEEEKPRRRTSRRSTRDEEPEDDYDDNDSDDYGDEDFEDAPVKSRSRKNTSRRSQSRRSNVEVDDDVDDYTDNLVN